MWRKENEVLFYFIIPENYIQILFCFFVFYVLNLNKISFRRKTWVNWDTFISAFICHVCVHNVSLQDHLKMWLQWNKMYAWVEYKLRSKDQMFVLSNVISTLLISHYFVVTLDIKPIMADSKIQCTINL